MTLHGAVADLMQRAGSVAFRPTGISVTLNRTFRLCTPGKTANIYAVLSAADVLAEDWEFRTAEQLRDLVEQSAEPGQG